MQRYTNLGLVAVQTNKGTIVIFSQLAHQCCKAHHITVNPTCPEQYRKPDCMDANPMFATAVRTT